MSDRPWCETCRTDRYHTHADYCCECGACIKSDDRAESSLTETATSMHWDWACGACIGAQLVARGAAS